MHNHRRTATLLRRNFRATTFTCNLTYFINYILRQISYDDTTEYRRILTTKVTAITYNIHTMIHRIHNAKMNNLDSELCSRAVRRRRRPNVGVAPAPFSWRVHVMLYTSCMLLAFCNVVYNEAWTLTKSSKNDAGVFFNSHWHSNETCQRQSKSVFVDNFVKSKADAKNLVWNFFANSVNEAGGTVKVFNTVYCSNCL